MFESNVFDFFSEDDIQKPIQLKAIIGPDLIFDHNLDPETFTGKICGCAMVQSKELFGENKVLSGAFSNHDSLYSDYRYTRKEYHAAGSGCTAGIPQSGACKRTGTPVSRKRMGKGKKRDYPYLPGIEGSDV